MNKKLIPNKSAKESMKNFNEIKWYMYARKMTKNPFMKNYIYNLHNGLCSWCKRKLIQETFVIHHTDYEHECIFDEVVEVLSPTPKNPNRKKRVPDCEKCFKENKTEFLKCENKIVPVHKLCNVEIEKEFVKINGVV